MQSTTAPTLSVGELCTLYLAHAASYYRRRDGQPSREHLNIRATLSRFEAFANSTSPAARINRHQVRAWMDQLAAEELSRSYVNQCLQRLRRAVRWAADLEYLPLHVDAELRLVRPLRAHRSPAREPVKRTPPQLSTLAKISPFLPRVARDVIQLAELTGARPSELLTLTNAEVHVDEHGARLTPLQHKTAHHGHQRVIPLCPEALRIVERHWRPLLPLDRLFPSRSRRGHYTIDGLRSAFKRALKRAGLPDCQLYDIRRAVARTVRAGAGLDAAQALLGHAHASTTEIYAPISTAEERTLAIAHDACARLLQRRPS